MINVDLAVAILIGLVDHVLELLVIDSLSELCHGSEVAEGDPGGVVVEQLKLGHLDVLAGPFSSTSPVIIARGSAKSVPLPLPSMSETIIVLAWPPNQTECISAIGRGSTGEGCICQVDLPTLRCC